jgi:hypothetical protein
LFYDFNTKRFFHASDENLNFHPARQLVFFNDTTYFISLDDASIYNMSTEFVTYNYNLSPTTIGEMIPRIRICKAIREENSARFRIRMFTFWIEQGVNNYYLMPYPAHVCDGLLITQTGSHHIVTQKGDLILSQSGSCNSIFDIPRVDLSFSKNGNESFSNIVGNNLNPQGRYINQIRWWNFGQANELTIQLRFWGFQRVVAKDGVAEVIS